MNKVTKGQKKLIEDNIRLSYYNAKKWSNKLSRNYNLTFDDIVSDCMLGLIKAAKALDIERGIKFATFAVRVMDNQILMTLRISKKIKENYISFYQRTDLISSHTYYS